MRHYAASRVARGNLTPGLPQNPGVTISRHRALLTLTASARVPIASARKWPGTGWSAVPMPRAL